LHRLARREDLPDYQAGQVGKQDTEILKIARPA
jgi:hypothetical protein